MLNQKTLSCKAKLLQQQHMQLLGSSRQQLLQHLFLEKELGMVSLRPHRQCLQEGVRLAAAQVSQQQLLPLLHPSLAQKQV
jgi:hypothetical protein